MGPARTAKHRDIQWSNSLLFVTIFENGHCVQCGDLLTSKLKVFCLDKSNCAEASSTAALPSVWNQLNCGVHLLSISLICNVWGFLSLVLNSVAAALWSLLSTLIHPLTATVQPHAVSVQVYAVIWWSFLISYILKITSYSDMKLKPNHSCDHYLRIVLCYSVKSINLRVHIWLSLRVSIFLAILGQCHKL